jgi:hypothetical protein
VQSRVQNAVVFARDSDAFDDGVFDHRAPPVAEVAQLGVGAVDGHEETPIEVGVMPSVSAEDAVD